ncbi:hypothetical protein QVH35_07315 [Candidatus Nitrosotenuis chungbukensis]|uniref:hypothetical protein n=1 Tax=Candidatus Nitrosotenuis chungbukensis TaxID=1353246 RepID=UPI0005B2C010|nr:hypothetical protein [Candidatus Nitrosotenuis chungbukensis]WKT57236.1 hypothetical protein QVH35_07315 [Candidatus Nitrosotenuis chungbukensis]
MRPLFQLSTRRYDEEIELIKKAMIDLESKCNVRNGYEIGAPSRSAGWTFFNIQISPEMLDVIEKSGMMEGAIGYRIEEQLKNFLGHFLESHGSNVRIKKIDY